MSKLIHIKILKNYAPIERNLELEKPLNAKLEFSNLGVVLGGSSHIKRNKNGKRELNGCTLDIILTSYPNGIAVIQEFLQAHGLKEFSEILTK